MNVRRGVSVTGMIIGLSVVLAAGAAVFVVVRSDRTGTKGSGLSKQFDYDLAEYKKTDPTLILYQEIPESVPLDFKTPLGIAVGGNDHIYVVGDDVIRIFSPEGRALSKIATGDTPRCLTVAANGLLYVGISDHVEVYDDKGERKAVWERPDLKAVLTSIAVSGNNVFVADAGDRAVLRYNTSGKLLNRIGQKDPAKNISGFNIPSPYFDLAVAGDGLLRVANTGQHRIEAYTFDGDLEFQWGTFDTAAEGFSGCCNPINFALLADGGFVTCEKGLTRVKIYDAAGKFVGFVAGPESFSQHDGICRMNGGADNCNTGGLDVAVDSKGRILVMDPLTREVRIFVRTKAG